MRRSFLTELDQAELTKVAEQNRGDWTKTVRRFFFSFLFFACSLLPSNERRLTLPLPSRAELTFIVHLRSAPAPSPSADPAGFLAAHNDASTMLGDANIFLHDVSPPPSPSLSASDAPPPPADTPTTPTAPPTPRRRRAELEIMFPPSALFPPRSGLALSTLRLFLSYTARALSLPPSAFFARIGFDNGPSLGLFAKLGFEEGTRVEVFREVEMVWKGGEGGEGWPWEKEEGWRYEEVVDPRDEERD